MPEIQIDPIEYQQDDDVTQEEQLRQRQEWQSLYEEYQAALEQKSTNNEDNEGGAHQSQAEEELRNQLGGDLQENTAHRERFVAVIDDSDTLISIRSATRDTDLKPQGKEGQTYDFVNGQGGINEIINNKFTASPYQEKHGNISWLCSVKDLGNGQRQVTWETASFDVVERGDDTSSQDESLTYNEHETQSSTPTTQTEKNLDAQQEKTRPIFHFEGKGEFHSTIVESNWFITTTETGSVEIGRGEDQILSALFPETVQAIDHTGHMQETNFQETIQALAAQPVGTEVTFVGERTLAGEPLDFTILRVEPVSRLEPASEGAPAEKTISVTYRFAERPAESVSGRVEVAKQDFVGSVERTNRVEGGGSEYRDNQEILDADTASAVSVHSNQPKKATPTTIELRLDVLADSQPDSPISPEPSPVAPEVTEVTFEHPSHPKQEREVDVSVPVSGIEISYASTPSRTIDMPVQQADWAPVEVVHTREETKLDVISLQDSPTQSVRTPVVSEAPSPVVAESASSLDSHHDSETIETLTQVIEQPFVEVEQGVSAVPSLNEDKSEKGFVPEVESVPLLTPQLNEEKPVNTTEALDARGLGSRITVTPASEEEVENTPGTPRLTPAAQRAADPVFEQAA